MVDVYEGLFWEGKGVNFVFCSCFVRLEFMVSLYNLYGFFCKWSDLKLCKFVLILGCKLIEIIYWCGGFY